MSAEATEKVADDLGEAIGAKDDVKSNEKLKSARSNYNEATKDLTPKEKKGIFYSGPGIIQWVMKKTLGIEIARPWIRQIMYVLDLGSFASGAQIIRKIRKETQIAQLKQLRKTKQYNAIREKELQYIRKGKKATFTRMSKEVSRREALKLTRK